LSISLGILVINSADYIEKLLRAGQDFADEIVIGIDSSSTDSTEQICREYADKIFLLEPIGTSERALAWLNDQCTGDWILRLDHDELPSSGLLEALPRLTSDREYTHYWLPRRWIFGESQSRWISQDPWWPDWQIRLFRNIRSLVSFPGHLHSDYIIQGAGGYFCEGSIYHYDLVYNNKQRRQQKMQQYEQISPGGSMSDFYFPSETVSTRPIPDEDRPWSGGLELRRPEHSFTEASPLKYVSMVEMRQAESSECEYLPDTFRATLECLDCPGEMKAGKMYPIQLRVRNDSAVTWWGSGLRLPQVHISYHWLLQTSQEVYEFEGVRTKLSLTLRPDESIKLIAQVLAPWESGSYLLKWDPLIENVSWFSTQGWAGPEIGVQVSFSHHDNAVLEQVGKHLQMSQRIPGWIRGEEAEALARASHSLADEAVIVEIGSFLGSGTVLLAGPRKVRGSGKVHCVDPFDCSGDPFSVPVYQQILANVGGGSLRERFEQNIRRFDLSEWIEVHQGAATQIAATWSTPIDLLLLDGDQSRAGARAAYDSWSPFLKVGGIIAIHNSNPRMYAHDHDGHRLLVLEEIVAPRYTEIRLIVATTFARKVN
jgi:predicted O-methyltransferase YrrM